MGSLSDLDGSCQIFVASFTQQLLPKYLNKCYYGINFFHI
jgi:hypothetical protein